MKFDKKITEILEGLNQSAIAYMQQRDSNQNSYKYTAKQSKQSYRKYGTPTVYAAKVNGAPFSGPGISDEENKKKKKLKKKKKSL